MEFFSNSCKRYCRRTASPVEVESTVVHQRTATRQQHETVTSSNTCSRIGLCCATVMLYCYAARGRRDNRSSRTGKTTGQSASSTGALDDVITADIGKLELPRLHHSSSPKSRNTTQTGTRGSILKTPWRHRDADRNQRINSEKLIVVIDRNSNHGKQFSPGR